jgi:hypothetical protein
VTVSSRYARRYSHVPCVGCRLSAFAATASEWSCHLMRVPVCSWTRLSSAQSLHSDHCQSPSLRIRTTEIIYCIAVPLRGHLSPVATLFTASRCRRVTFVARTQLRRPLDRTLSHGWMTAVLFKIARLLHPLSLSTYKSWLLFSVTLTLSSPLAI